MPYGTLESSRWARKGGRWGATHSLRVPPDFSQGIVILGFEMVQRLAQQQDVAGAGGGTYKTGQAFLSFTSH